MGKDTNTIQNMKYQLDMSNKNKLRKDKMENKENEIEWERNYLFRTINSIPIMNDGCGPGQLMEDPPKKYLCSWAICPDSFRGWNFFKQEIAEYSEHPRLCNSHHMMLYLLDVKFSEDSPRKLDFDNLPILHNVVDAALKNLKGIKYSQDITLVEKHKEKNNLEILIKDKEELSETEGK